MHIKELREKAIKRYINGESPKEIYQSLGKGKRWFFQWLKRYRLDEKDWVLSHSYKPHLSPKRIHKSMEQMIIATRKKMEKKKYAQFGASNIVWRLKQIGIPSPSIATINRIISRNHIVITCIKSMGLPSDTSKAMISFMRSISWMPLTVEAVSILNAGRTDWP